MRVASLSCLECGCPAIEDIDIEWTCPYCGNGFVRLDIREDA